MDDCLIPDCEGEYCTNYEQIVKECQTYQQLVKCLSKLLSSQYDDGCEVAWKIKSVRKLSNITKQKVHWETK